MELFACHETGAKRDKKEKDGTMGEQSSIQCIR